MEHVIVRETISGILHNIARHISANSARITDRGLLSGKMGGAIFLYHYAQCYNNMVCAQLADSFIEDIRNNMSEITSVDYSNGLSGIEAGLNYLLKKGFIDARTAEMPEKAVQAIYNSPFNLRRNDMHDYLYRLTGLGKYFMQDHRKKLLTTAEPFSDLHRQCVSHIINLLSVMDVAFVQQQHYSNMLRVTDVLSKIYTTGFREKDMRGFLSLSLKALEVILFNNANFKPFCTGGNAFVIVLALLQIYNRTSDQRFVTLAIRLLKEYEGAANNLYTEKNIRDIDLLQHAIACRKLQAILMDGYFQNCAAECLNFYRERKNSRNSSGRYNNGDDYSLDNGYTAEGMALLTLEGLVELDWLEDLVGYY